MDECIRPVSSSCQLPSNIDQPVLRYMNIEKFEYLLENKSLYLCRADKLQDIFEGCYSQEQIAYQEKYLQDSGWGGSEKEQANARRLKRRQTYISCWCMSDYDFDLMWKAYVGTESGVAIKSTAKQLQAICEQSIDCWPLDISEVEYYDQAGGRHIGYNRLSPFLHKDKHFELDREMRIIQWGNWKEPTPDHLDLPVILDQLILAVILSPKSSKNDMNTVKNMLKRHNLENIPVELSRNDREPVD